VAVREKKHRLPKEFYKGEISAVFTLCLMGKARFFIEPEVVRVFTDILASVVTKMGCIIPVYCFMPDHQHLIIKGMRSDSDIREAMVRHKQKTGFWMSLNKSEVRWQKDFYDHVLEKYRDIVLQVKYVLDNPVRKGLAPFWQEYPFKGSIGCKLEDFLIGIV